MICNASRLHAVEVLCLETPACAATVDRCTALNTAWTDQNARRLHQQTTSFDDPLFEPSSTISRENAQQRRRTDFHDSVLSERLWPHITAQTALFDAGQTGIENLWRENCSQFGELEKERFGDFEISQLGELGRNGLAAACSRKNACCYSCCIRSVLMF